MESQTAQQTNHEQSGPIEVVDRPEDRPGVPMEAEAAPDRGAHWETPPVQEGASEHLRRAGLDRPTPVVGTAQPPHGFSGLLRTQAYRIPEHFSRHWALLLLADRVDVLEDRMGPALARPLEEMGFHEGSRYVRRNPIGTMAGLLFGAWLAKRVLVGR
jgi:hypothetical protein